MPDLYVSYNLNDKGGRRTGIERRRFSYTGHIPERRSGSDRRTGLDRRSGEDRRGSEARRTECNSADENPDRRSSLIG